MRSLVDVICSLPADLVGFVVYPFLGLADVARLDSALLMESKRQWMAETLRWTAPLEMGSLTSNVLTALDWSIKRRVAIKRLVITGDFLRAFERIAEAPGVCKEVDLELCASTSNSVFMAVPDYLLQSVRSLDVVVTKANRYSLKTLYMPALTRLRINSITDEAPIITMMNNHVNLSELWVKFCPRPFSDEFCMALYVRGPSLTHLSLISQYLSQGVIDIIGERCSKLEHLHFDADSDILSCNLAAIAEGCASLHTLSLINLVPDTLSLQLIVHRCPALKRLEVPSVPLRGEVFTSLAHCGQRLVTLNCTWLDDGLAVGVWGNLRTFTVHCLHEDQPRLTSALAQMLQLRELNISLPGEKPIRLHWLLPVASCCRYLTTLVLKNSAAGDSTATLNHLVQQCTALQVLCLHGDWRVTDTTLTLLAAHCRDFHSLACEGNKVTDVGICALAKSCAKLRVLNLAECTAITNASLRTLVQCANLRLLGLNKASNLTDAGVAAFVRHANQQKLETLRIHRDALNTELYSRLTSERRGKLLIQRFGISTRRTKDTKQPKCFVA